MNRGQIALVLHALALLLAMVLLVRTLTQAFGTSGYLLVLALYWVGFCLPVIFIHVGRRHDERLFSERLAWRDWFVPLLLLFQVCAVALAAFMPNTAVLTTQGAMLACVVAVINGPLEETAWRGAFMARFSDNRRLGFWLGWALFSAWHLPLLLSHGIAFDGGWMALVGGAAGLGLLWSWIAWRTGSVFWVSIAHALTNAVTFWVLFNRNGFVSPHP